MVGKLLMLRNWSRLPQKYGADEELLYANQRNILFSKIALGGSIVSFLHGLEGLTSGIMLLSAMDLILALSIFASYLINELGKHIHAKIFLLTFLNLFFFVYALVTPREMGIFLYYFSWVAIAALVFESDEHFCRWFFMLISIALLLILFGSDFNLLASYRTTDLLIGNAFVINFITNLVITISVIIMVVNMHETTERKYRTLAREIKAKNVDLQKSNEELDRFVYSASHDLKVPINSIKGLIHIAQRDCTDPKSLSYFTRIENQTDRLGAFLLELFEYSRNQRLNLRPERVSIAQLVDEVVESLQLVTGAERIDFKKYVRVPGMVKIDRVRLMVILNNLISNAIQYHNLEEEDPWVKIMINQVDHVLQITIADNGMGIREDHQDKVFDMFFRGTDRPIGNGLGLFIVKETVEKLQGKIMLSSNAGGGSCFRIDVPLMA